MMKKLFKSEKLFLKIIILLKNREIDIHRSYGQKGKANAKNKKKENNEVLTPTLSPQ